MKLANQTPKNIINSIILILSVLIALGTINSCQSQRINSQDDTTTTTTTTPESYLEEPSNSATSESSDYDECLQCYDKVTRTSQLIAEQLKLDRKHNEMVKRFQKSLRASSGNQTRKANKLPTSPPAKRQNNSTSTSNNTVRNRALTSTDLDSESIVISRLRVARSSPDEQLKLRSLNEKLELALKQMKHKQTQHHNETCNSLYGIRDCVESLSRQCLGNLQYHSHDTFQQQWLNKFNCPPSNNPKFRPYAYFHRSVDGFKQEEQQKVGIARQSSHEEDVQKRLNKIFQGQHPMAPFGVMLKPHLNKEASARFQQQQQHQQQQTLSSASKTNVGAGRHLLYELADSSSVVNNGQHNQEQQQLAFLGSQMFLIPCFLILLLSLIATTVRLHR